MSPGEIGVPARQEAPRAPGDGDKHAAAGERGMRPRAREACGRGRETPARDISSTGAADDGRAVPSGRTGDAVRGFSTRHAVGGFSTRLGRRRVLGRARASECPRPGTAVRTHGAFTSHVILRGRPAMASGTAPRPAMASGTAPRGAMPCRDAARHAPAACPSSPYRAPCPGAPSLSWPPPRSSSDGARPPPSPPGCRRTGRLDPCPGSVR